MLVRISADSIDTGLQRHPAEDFEGQLDEGHDPAAQGSVGLGKDKRLFGIGSRGLHRVGQAPMAGDRLARPGRAFLGRRRVADGEDEIHHDRARLLELRDVLGPQAGRVMAVALQDFQREGVQLGVGARSGGEGLELALAQIAQQCLGKDRAGRVARADEKHVEIGVGDIRVHLGGVLWGREQGGKKIGPGATHIEGEVADQSFGRVEIDGVVERPADPRDLHEARGRQVCQMVRQRVLLQPERLGDLGRPHALRRKAHQETKDRHPTGMAERGKGMGGAILFHISRLKEINECVQ